MSDVTSDGRTISVTIKYGKGYEETWAGFKGLASEVREDILAYFAMEPAEYAELSLNAVVTNATKIAHGIGVVAVQLGGTVVSEGAAPANDADAVWDETSADQAGTPSTPTNPLYAQIEALTSVEELTKLWATNQSAFSDADLMAAYKAKGKALQAAAA